MVRRIKNLLYFSVASYFRFFAGIRLKRWGPRVVVVTGSNGKTTALNLIEVQLGKVARYSHGANSSFGIPFDILGLKRFEYSILEWVAFAIRAPFQVFTKLPKEKIYVVEADCDRPGEGPFLSALLKPEVVVWLSSARTHSMNFEKRVRAGVSANVDDAIAHEFGHFLERAQNLCIVNADEPRIEKELSRTHAAVHHIHKAELQQYSVSIGGTEFVINGTRFRAPLLLPQEVFYSIAASVKVAQYFGVRPTSELWKLEMPPSRSSIFKGIKNTVLIDSTYNANTASVAAVLEMVKKFPSRETWLVLGDLIEQGSQEKEEHENVARMIHSGDFRRIVFVGPRMRQYALPLVQGAIAFDTPLEALTYLRRELKGGETLVFKGARFLEGVVEHLLENPADAEKLCRREAVWQKRRAQWGL